MVFSFGSQRWNWIEFKKCEEFLPWKLVNTVCFHGLCGPRWFPRFGVLRRLRTTLNGSKMFPKQQKRRRERFRSLRIHVWYIYLHLVDFYGKCRYIYHTWILWGLEVFFGPGSFFVENGRIHSMFPFFTTYTVSSLEWPWINLCIAFWGFIFNIIQLIYCNMKWYVFDLT